MVVDNNLALLTHTSSQECKQLRIIAMLLDGFN
jgi:hypothetical protein